MSREIPERFEIRIVRWTIGLLLLIVAVQSLLAWGAHQSNDELARTLAQASAAQAIPALERLGTRGDGSALDQEVSATVLRSGDLQTAVFLLWFGRERAWWPDYRNALMRTIQDPGTREAAERLARHERKLRDLPEILDAWDTVVAAAGTWAPDPAAADGARR